MGNSITQSSLTKKFVMAFAGLFLVSFLFVHLGINLLVLLPSSDAFNVAAHFMGTNLVIKVFEIVLFGGIVIHMVYGVILQIQNWMARPRRYKVEGWSHTSPFSKFMIHTAVIVTIFLVYHLLDFYVETKFLGEINDVVIGGTTYPDMGAKVIGEFKMLGVVIFYIISFLILGFHLHHGFQSGFQSLGLEHSKYTPVIKFLSTVVAVVLTVGFAIIPLVIYFGNY
jgi:succinate dehydrogenase / fumarate reductase, cytochrome b subunit